MRKPKRKIGKEPKSRMAKPIAGVRSGFLLLHKEPLSLESVHHLVVKSLHHTKWERDPGKAPNPKTVDRLAISLIGLYAHAAKAGPFQKLTIKEIMLMEANKKIPIVTRNNRILDLVGRRKKGISVFLRMQEIANDAAMKRIADAYHESRLKKLSKPVYVKDKKGKRYYLGHEYCSKLVEHAFTQAAVFLNETNSTILHSGRMQQLSKIKKSPH